VLLLALELGDVQRQCNAGWIAAQQLDVVRHVVLVGLEADAARSDALGRQVEAELAQLIGRRLRSESVKER